MQSVPKYGRIQITVPDGCKTVSVTRPDGVKETALPFRCQNTRFVYDKHGFERQEIDGGAFTDYPGDYERYRPESVNRPTRAAPRLRRSFRHWKRHGVDGPDLVQALDQAAGRE